MNYLQVRVENHDLLCANKQVHISAGLILAIWSLSRNRQKIWITLNMDRKIDKVLVQQSRLSN